MKRGRKKPGKPAGNEAALRQLFAQLDELGVREFQVCGGARNATIIDALVRRGAVLRHFADERCASFFTLGRVMQTRRPAAVLTTSGTAAAELLPAMVEAHHQHLPLLAITADRPLRYAGSGAPQAIMQVDLFGSFVGHPGGPVHLNVRLEEGLGAAHESPVKQGEELRSVDPGGGSTAADRRNWRRFWEADGEVLVLAAGLHPADVPAARDFLLALRAPVVAEATANLHQVGELRRLLVKGGEKFLRGTRARRVLRLGAVPSWRWWRDLEAREDVRVLNVTRSWYRGLARQQDVTTVPWAALEGATPDRIGGQAAKGATDPATLLDRYPRSEAAWMRHLSRLIGPSACVFLGNSLPIREWNLAAEAAPAGATFYANRGANGIDGLISTFLGVSADAAEAWCVVGDLSALHDAGAPWILPQLSTAKRRIVVMNNGGGKIFSRVNWLKSMPPAGMRALENPHALGFEPWARMWGVEYRLITDPRELRDDDAPCAVWEIRPDPAETEQFWSAWS